MDTMTNPTQIAAERRPQGTRRTSRLVPWTMVLPALLLITAVTIVPTIYTIYISLFNLRAGGGLLGVKKELFVGLDNYFATLTDGSFWTGFGNMLIYGVIMVPATLVLAVVFALVLDHLKGRLVTFSRLAIFLPYAVPGVLAALMWGFLYMPGVSPLRAAFTSVALPAPDFFSTHNIYGSLANIGVWGAIGFNMIIMFTSLKSIPTELSDSARIDGCSEFQIALRIKLPIIRPTILLTGLFVLIGTLQVFSEPQTLRPLTSAVTPQFTPMMVVYNQAFAENDLNGAGASAILIMVITVVGTAAVFATTRIRSRRAS